MKDKDK